MCAATTARPHPRAIRRQRPIGPAMGQDGKGVKLELVSPLSYWVTVPSTVAICNFRLTSTRDVASNVSTRKLR